MAGKDKTAVGSCNEGGSVAKVRASWEEQGLTYSCHTGGGSSMKAAWGWLGQGPGHCVVGGSTPLRVANRREGACTNGE